MVILFPAKRTLLKCASLLTCVVNSHHHYSNNVLSTNFTHRVILSTQILLSQLPTLKFLVPKVILSYVPPIESVRISHTNTTNIINNNNNMTTIPVAVKLRNNNNNTMRLYSLRREREHFTFSIINYGNFNLRHQLRAISTTGISGKNCGGDISISSDLNIRQQQQQQQDEEKKRKERPRLICTARRSEPRNSVVASSNNNNNTMKVKEVMTDIIQSRKIRSNAELVNVSGNDRDIHSDQGKYIPEVLNNNNNNKIKQEKETSKNIFKVKNPNIAVNIPSFHHIVKNSNIKDYESNNDSLVYNIFTHRVVKCSAASVRALGVLGIGVRNETQQLDIISSDTLIELREKLINKEVSWHSSWRNSIFRQFYHILLNSINNDEAINEVRKLLSTHYERAKARRGVGIVANRNNINSTDNSTNDNENSNSNNNISFQERLLTYRDLNEEQQKVVDFTLEGYNTYIGGGAGTGKSLLLRVIKQELVNRGLTVAMTATTGIAATRIDGITLHHCFGINIHGESTRRAELKAFDVIIIDEVSMLSKEIFELLEYQLRRANGVDLPFGGIQIILSGDFLQLGAIASLSIIHSAIFRRNFAMLKLHTVVRQLGNNLFVKQLQELRRGIIPHDLQDTITFLSSSEILKKNKKENEKEEEEEEEEVVKLLPTNKEVDAINQFEIDKLPGDLAVFPAQLKSPSLAGRWSSTYVLQIQYDNPNLIDIKNLALNLEEYVLEFVKKVPYASTFTLSLLGQRNIVLYKIFVDAFAFRVRIPLEMNEKDEQEFSHYLREMETWLPSKNLGVSLKEIISSPDGLHTDVDEYTLTQYANNSPMNTSLHLKKGARVMLRTNLAPGLVNGSLGIVVGFKELRPGQLPKYLSTPSRLEAIESYIECLQYEHGFTNALAPEVDFGGGRIITIPPTIFCVGGLSNTNHYQMGIIALPLTLAYAFTVHKVQGLTLLGRVHLELSRMWPCEHLLYVAMSRVRNPEQLTISSFQNELVQCAAECLIFDDSLPNVGNVKVLPHFFQATWQRTPSRRKLSLRQKQKFLEKQKGEIDNNKKNKEKVVKKRSCITRGRY